MSKLNFVILIDNNVNDNYVSQKKLENFGVFKVVTFQNASSALLHLMGTKTKYDMIFVTIDMPFMTGFEFINEYNQFDLHKRQSKICLISSALTLSEIEMAKSYKTKLIEKPLTVEKLNEITKGELWTEKKLLL